MSRLGGRFVQFPGDSFAHGFVFWSLNLFLIRSGTVTTGNRPFLNNLCIIHYRVKQTAKAKALKVPINEEKKKERKRWVRFTESIRGPSQ